MTSKLSIQKFNVPQTFVFIQLLSSWDFHLMGVWVQQGKHMLSKKKKNNCTEEADTNAPYQCTDRSAATQRDQLFIYDCNAGYLLIFVIFTIWTLSFLLCNLKGLHCCNSCTQDGKSTSRCHTASGHQNCSRCSMLTQLKRLFLSCFKNNSSLLPCHAITQFDIPKLSSSLSEALHLQLSHFSVILPLSSDFVHVNRIKMVKRFRESIKYNCDAYQDLRKM